MYRNPHDTTAARFPKLRIAPQLFHNRLPQLLACDRVSFARQTDIVGHITIPGELPEYFTSNPTVEYPAYVARAFSLL
jgi:hypothetical protein